MKCNSKIMAYIVIFLIPMSGLAIDIYTPALPLIKMHYRHRH